jgi:predicted transcriptional regulator
MTNSLPWDSADGKPPDKKRRSQMQIEAAIIKVVISDYLTTNQIAIRVNVNRVLAKSYMKKLAERGLVETKKIKGLTNYSATPKGIAWLKRFESLGP